MESPKLNGKLAKAPKFDDVQGFKKEEQNLFPVHIYIDMLGFIWVNLDFSTTPIPWEDDFKGVDTEEERFEQFDLSQYKFHHTWQTTTMNVIIALRPTRMWQSSPICHTTTQSQNLDISNISPALRKTKWKTTSRMPAHIIFQMLA